MPLFARNTNNEILLAIEHIKIQHALGYAMESILTNLAGMNFGRVSKKANAIMARVKSGAPLNDAFIQETPAHKNMQTMFFILKDGGPEMRNRLIDLSDRILKETALSVDNLIDNMAVNLNRLMMIMTVPLSVFFLQLLQDSFNVAKFDITIPPIVTTVIVVGDAIILFAVLAMMRYE